MEVSSSYTLITSAWLALQSAPLLITPSILLPLLSSAEAGARATALETYLSRSLALSHLTLAALSLLLSGLIPLSSLSSARTTAPSDSSTTPEAQNAAMDTFLLPVTLVTTLHHFATAFYAYANYTATGQTAFALGLVGSGALASLGMWCVLFARERGHVSRRTGLDKRVSGWPLGDKKGRVGKDL